MNQRILIIDDNDHIRSILKLTLEFKGYNVTEAGDGGEALGKIQGADPFDLIFCDIEMPTVSGVEFVRRFRAQHGPATPILMLSAEGDELLEAALAAGATSAHSKPFQPGLLLAEVQRHLGAAV